MMTQYVQTRNQIVDTLVRDQFGPYSGRDECLPENPLRRYMVGILHPRGIAFDEADDDGGQVHEPVTRNDDSEPGLRMSNTVAPSSFGITFACSEDTGKIMVFVQFGKYMPIGKTEENPDAGTESTGKGKKWQREEIFKEFVVSVLTPGDQRHEIVAGELSLRVRSRPVDGSGSRPITISVVNDQRCPRDDTLESKAKKSFFQLQFGVKGIDEESSFVSRTDAGSDNSVSEENSIRLLYRSVHSFATGHGCSAQWEENPGCSRCSRIVSSFVPWHIVYPMTQPDDLGLPRFSVKEISSSSGAELSRILTSIPDRYDVWILKQRKRIEKENVTPELQAEEHLKKCSQASDRIRRGIGLIVKDETVYEAFILMHKAMLHQISRSIWFKEDRPAGGPVYSSEHSWYPFQMAFILLCLESLCNPESEDRGLVDLLWFPTGGGKTEAYLGIIAFMIFLRRLRSIRGHGDGGGTTALMRYTLRLLTVDQFYRAALLACSCEKTRREDKSALRKNAPVSIGLWVGGEASPNRWQDAREALEAINAGAEEPKKGNPLKIRSCPWCGQELGPADYTVPDAHTSMLIRCNNEDCDFNDGLPIWLTDSDVYRNKPSLIIGTVDKFARIPWVEEAGQIFGSDGETSPPEVIIQDELHLISGPLGTMVGLYETAVDALCGSIEGPPPKIIASTATIRNAENQVLNLFSREVNQFPPPGLDYSDSFFARENRSLPGRSYVGVFTPGTSATTALVRTFGILLHAAGKIKCDPEIRDAYWTLMAYFNSLRELGGASVQVEDDVNDYLKICAERDGDPLALREVRYKAELTGRVDSTELEEIRGNLWRRYPEPDCPDVVLATNMISVGLDVPRLGLMSIVGQPKSTSEYIQATSRIGRRHPGLVVTIYNWTRSRDRSHFERFKGYHSRLYSEVEATSVTPFSSRARDRGLHAVLISMIRHLVSRMGPDKAAAAFEGTSRETEKMMQFIISRVGKVDSREQLDTEKAVKDIVRRWQKLADGGDLVYAKKKSR